MLNQVLRPVLEHLPENNRMERIWVLAKVDFLKRYNGSFLGLVWALINPITQLAIYYFVFTAVFQNRQPFFALFLFLGLIMFLFFAETSTKGLHLLHQKRYLIENIQLNWIDIYLAATASTFFAFLFNFSAYLGVSFFFTIKISPQVWLVLFLALNLLAFALAMQIILSVIQIFLKDIEHLWDMAKMAILWLSGIFYPIDPEGAGLSAALAYLTPLPGIVFNARQVLIYGESVNWNLLIYDLGFTILLLGGALLLFHRFSRFALEKL